MSNVKYYIFRTYYSTNTAQIRQVACGTFHKIVILLEPRYGEQHTYVIHMGDKWEIYGRHVYGRHMGDIWETYGRYMGDICMGYIWETYVWDKYGRHNSRI